MGAFKKHEGRKYYFDMTDVRANYVFLHANACSRAKQRALKRLDPFAHRVGNYRKYRTPEDLQQHIEEYFQSCMSPLRNKYGDVVYDDDGKKVMVQTKPYTLSGLSNHLGITTNTLRTYHTKAVVGKIPIEYADIILAARQRIEEYAECQLYSRDGSRGGQFVLQAGFNWQTKQERSETKLAKKRAKMQEKEFKLKQNILNSGTNEDSSIEIRITRASKRTGEQKNEDED